MYFTKISDKPTRNMGGEKLFGMWSHGRESEKLYFTESDEIGPSFRVSISAKFLDY
jgi:hypothetical protein